ncbi:MAG: Hsp70 family protein [Pseudomonadota bacterium]
MSAPVLAVDFGTSNSAAAVLDGGVPRRLGIEPGADTLPTSVFFPSDGGPMCIGSAANDALIEGEEGRYMRALKSILGTPLFHESRPIGGRRRTLAEIVTGFLSTLKVRAEAETATSFTRVLSGRPVHFHSRDNDRDGKAEDDLRACYLAAGFEEVRFLYEPEAAARACSGLSAKGEAGLIVDIGGGTSDFSVFRAAGCSVDILASHGIRLGGTDFDRKISLDHVMPLMGLGGKMRRAFGAGLLPVPNALYQELATWAEIPFLYTAETERKLKDMLRFALEPDKIRRLERVIADRLGHELAFAVEAGKIAANAHGAGDGIDLSIIEAGLHAPTTPAAFSGSLAPFGDRLQEAMSETLVRAGTRPEDIRTAILVGGSSLMEIVVTAVRTVCRQAQVQRSEAFTAVVDGLALASGEGW